MSDSLMNKYQDITSEPQLQEWMGRDDMSGLSAYDFAHFPMECPEAHIFPTLK